MDNIVLISIPYETLGAIIRSNVERVLNSRLASQKEKPEPVDKLISKKDAAEILGCSASTVDNFRRSGKLTRVSIGKSARFRMSEVQAIVSKKGSNHE